MLFDVCFFKYLIISVVCFSMKSVSKYFLRRLFCKCLTFVKSKIIIINENVSCRKFETNGSDGFNKGILTSEGSML